MDDCIKKINSTNRKEIIQQIVLIDGIAIFFIVFFHELGGKNTSDALFLSKYLGTCGLCLFTFTSGFKLHFNHSKEIEDKLFIQKYFKKRFIRLSKPYFGYTLLAFIPLYVTIYIAENYLNLHFESFNNFHDGLNISGILKLIIGSNFVAGQLWYLIGLLVITCIVFLILYFTKIKGLKILFPFITICSFVFQTQFTILNYIARYMPIYIFGVFFSYYLMYKLENNKTIILSILFIVLTLLPNYVLQYTINSKTIFFGFTFPCFTYLILLKSTKQKQLTSLFTIFGKNSFYIYLFHWPLILPVIDRLIFSIYQPIYFITPCLSTVISMIACICAYIICKKTKLNRLFE